MLYFNLNPILKARQIEKPYTYLVKAGVAPHTVTKILNSQMRVLRLDHIELLCKILHCEPSELLLYKPNANEKLQPGHPLLKLLAQENNLDWQETLKTAPLSQLKEIGKMIAQSKLENPQ